ncbi:MAG: EamA family transporter [Candidatus Sericytochromatia bacterium]
MDNSLILAVAETTSTGGLLSGWMLVSLVTLFFWGMGQGLIKMFIGDASPARFCLFFVIAKIMANTAYFMTHEHPNPFSQEGRTFMLVGIFAYILDGLGWLLYFQSIIYGPITIVGTLSAAYPALTALWAKFFLGEQLIGVQYFGVFLVISTCLGLSYSPADPSEEEGKKVTNKWIPFAAFALLFWSAAQTIMKYSYSLPNASEANMVVFNSIGGSLTLGVYGLMYGLRGGIPSLMDVGKSFLPMGMMAIGDIGSMVAPSYPDAKIAIVSALTGAYPVVTLGFGALVLKEKITKVQWLLIFILMIGVYLSSLTE